MRYVVCMFLLIWGSPGFAQLLDEPAHFDGDPFHPVWMEEGVLDEYYPDEDAVIIQDYCWVFFELFGRMPRIRYQYLRRIKILKEDGVSASQMTFEVHRADHDESLLDWKARTYSLNGEGEVVEFPVSKRGISMRNIDGKEVYSVELPFAKSGTVLELRYQIQSGSFDQLRPWAFMDELPVLRSAVTTYIPYSYKYIIIPTGDLSDMNRLTENYSSNGQVSARSRNISGTSPWSQDELIFHRSFSGEATTYSMLFVNPLTTDEAFAPESRRDYIPSITWQLSQDDFRRQTNEFLYDSWVRLDRVISRKYRRGRLARKDRKNIEAFTGRRNRGGKWATIKRLYLSIADFEWDGSYEVIPSNPGRAWRNQSGSAAELNMLLILTLQEAGIEAYPVLISTRDHGYVQSIYPLLTQFNHVLVAVEEGGETALLDVVSGIAKPGILPKNDLNGEGFILNGRGGEWVPLQSYQRVNQVTYSRLTMQPDGSLSGEVSVVNQGFSSELESIRYAELGEDPEAYFRKYVWAGETSPRLSNPRIEQVPEEKNALKMSWDVSMDAFVLKAENVFILEPMLMRSLVTNPFSQKKRIAPIDLTYPIWEAHMLGLRIPDGYEIAQAPESIRVLMPGNAGQFIYHVMQMGNIVHVTSSIQINRTRYQPDEYQGIKDFFDYIVTKHQEDIVIKKVE